MAVAAASVRPPGYGYFNNGKPFLLPLIRIRLKVRTVLSVMLTLCLTLLI